MKMALSRISLNPPPNIDPTRATLAYGRLAIKRINRELKDIDILTRQRAVKALSDYLHDPEHIAEAINEGVICSLSVLLKDPDISCKAYTTECFVIICQHAIGRTAALAHNILESFKPLTDFNQPDVIRLNIHKAIELLTTNLSGAEAIVKAGYIDLLVKCVEKEVDEIKAIILDTLYHCFSFDSDEGLNSGGIPLFTKLLSHSNSEIRTRAAQNILRLCVNPRGKQEALDNETIPALIGLLNDQSEDVKASSTGALAFICTTNHGRYTTLNAGAIPLLLCLVDNNNNSRIRINALKVLTCLSETPEGRRILLDYLDKISSHLNDTNAAVVKHTKIAISVITWKP
uniref:Rhabdoid tumor deletion region protein 1 n=1 Tax=Schistosoma japonicum TaxID=6182 RepID=C1LGL1_SCHJA|nr:Rhabdoid tumor deletion region protein 1 [Schistosoma japonicum]CAX73839.1 Rhabdoid tumor deletion region protein 1 [Schistosoma japonicum]